MNPVVTRVVCALVMALIAPHLQETTGIKLTNADVYTLIGLTPLAWHVIAAAWAREAIWRAPLRNSTSKTRDSMPPAMPLYVQFSLQE